MEWLTNSRIAKTHGFDFYQELEIKGNDDSDKRVDVFWNRLRAIPGTHRIRVRVWTSDDTYNDNDFRSGNRAELQRVNVAEVEGGQSLRFRFGTMPGGSPTVDKYAKIEGGTVQADWIRLSPQPMNSGS